jgi:hypothetical protein
MADERYLVKFKATTGLGSQVFVAETAEIQDDHLVLLNSEGKLAGLFLFEIESWSES